jgi:hypothetical protein
VLWIANEASIDGSCCARWMRYCARAASMLSTARRRSRLCANACATIFCSLPSRTNVRHGMSAILPPGSPAAPANCVGTGALGRSYVGAIDQQPDRATPAINKPARVTKALAFRAPGGARR